MCRAAPQAAQSDEPHYRRLLDGVEPRAALLAGPARAALQSAVTRLQAVSADGRHQRERLETLLDQLSAHHELLRTHQEWCRTTDEQIKAVSGERPDPGTVCLVGKARTDCGELVHCGSVGRGGE